MKELPPFRLYPADKAQEFAQRAFHQLEHDETSLIELIPYPDHHFRAVFRLTYFTLAEGQTSPSKSQWNTLKKHLKRMRQDVFILKDCGELSPEAGYLEFGFLPT